MLEPIVVRFPSCKVALLTAVISTVVGLDMATCGYESGNASTYSYFTKIKLVSMIFIVKRF